MSRAPSPPPALLSRTIAVGAAAGLLGGLFGVGGGLLIVPALVMLLTFDQRLAHGTSLAAVLPIAVAGLASYWSTGNVDWPVAAALTLGAIGGAVVGTKLLQIVPRRALGICFAVILLVAAVRLLLDSDGTGRGTLSALAVVALFLVGLLSGTLAGLLGVGGGVVMVPAMVVLFGITPVVAKGTSMAVIVPTAVMGTWRNREKRNADVRVGVILGVSGIIPAIVGGLIADRMDDALSNGLFAALLVFVTYRQLSTL